MRAIVVALLLCLCLSVQAAVIFTGADDYASNNADSSFTLNLPATVNVDDLLLVQINFGSSSITVNPPAGWTQLRVDTNSNDRQYLFYRFATGAAQDTGGAATSWALSGGSIRVAATLVGVRSDLGGRSVVLGASSAANGSGTTQTAPSATASAAGALLRFYGVESGNTVFMLPAALTQRATAGSANPNSGASALVASRNIAAAGATGSDAVTASRSGNWIVQSLLLTESAPSRPSTCFNDDFSSSATFGNDWVTTSVSGSFGTPRIVNGRLRLTNNTNNVSTAATLQRIFPTSNLIYVEFNLYAYPSGSGADGIAVTLSDASVTPQPGGFGGSLGYAQRSGINGFAGGWLGVALDEYGNFSNPSEGRNGGPGFRADAVAVRGSGSGTSGYAYVAGTAANIASGIDAATGNVNTPGPGHRYRIVIDAAAAGQTYVTVDRDTAGGSNYSNLIPTFNIEASAGQAPIPANLMLSLTGSTGGSVNIHEVDGLSVCATAINTAVQVDHFEITHDGQGLTCEPENVSIRACADAACSTLMSLPVTVTLNPAGGWVGGNVQTINGSATLQLRRTTPGNAPIAIASSSPGSRPFSTNVCNGVSTNTCNLAFADVGFAFDVPNVLANRPSGPVRLRALRNAGDTTNSCVALFQNSTQSVSFWSAYTSPNTGTRAVEVRPGSGSGAYTSVAGASPGTPLNLTFDDNGETTFEARYQDAGQMLLTARYLGTGSDAGLTITGADAFVSSPAGFCVRGAPVAAPTSYYTCTSDFANCPILAAAGNPFALNIAAAAWQVDGDTDFCAGNGNTPNYAQSGLALSSQFGLNDTQFGVGTGINGVDGIASPAAVAIAAGAGGVATVNASESEVGAFRFTVTPPANAYFGVTVPPGSSAILGRFTPHHFTVTGGALINRATSGCTLPSAFTYLDEPLQLDYTITAENAGNVRTQNYQGIFARLSTYAQTQTAAISTAPLRTALVPQPVGTFALAWSDGQAAVQSPVRVPRPATPAGPYQNTVFGVAPVDSDGIATIGLNLDTSVPADGAFERVLLNPATELRYGRLRLDSVSGPVDLPLSLPLTAEYWNGSGFVANTADSSCTTILASAGALSNYQGALGVGETLLGGTATINNGISTALQLSQAGAGNEGSVDITLNAIPAWLQFDWNGDGSIEGPTATASFGSYRGSDRVIFWQEVPN